MAKKIKLSLNSKDIQQARRELERIREQLPERTNLLVYKVAKRIEEYARQGFADAIVSDALRGGAKRANVTVTTQSDGTVCTVIADGKDAVFVEFGAGVYHNGATGSSPHPDGKRLGMLIGSYGEGRGKRNVWGYYDGGELILTHGAPAKMPLYNAAQRVAEELQSIAKEVFTLD